MVVGRVGMLMSTSHAIPSQQNHLLTLPNKTIQPSAFPVHSKVFIRIEVAPVCRYQSGVYQQYWAILLSGKDGTCNSCLRVRTSLVSIRYHLLSFYESCQKDLIDLIRNKEITYPYEFEDDEMSTSTFHLSIG